MMKTRRFALGALCAALFLAVGFLAGDSLGAQDPPALVAATTPAGWVPVQGPQGVRYVNTDHVTHIRNSGQILIIYFNVPQSFISVNNSPINRKSLGIE